MKRNKFPLIFLPVFIDSCSAETSAQLNTGSVKECLEGLTTKLALGKAAHRFADVDELKDKTVWDAAIIAGDIVPLFNVYEVASDNTDATVYETGNFVYTTKKEIKKMTSESYLSLCSHRALKSYENSDFTQIYEFTEEGEILAVYDDDNVRVKGQDMTNFDVAIRERPTNDKPAFSMTTITYRDFEEFEDKGIITKPTWDPNTLNGIFALTFQVLTMSATEITLKAKISCGSDTYDLLTVTEFKFVVIEDAGAPQTIDTVTNADGIYTLGGAAFVSGILSTDGVVTVGDYNLEAAGVAITI